MSEHCTWEGCAEPAVASLEDRVFCRKHFLAVSYRRLEEIAAQIREPRFRAGNAESAARFLEECMRCAADVACLPESPSNLEKAQVLDVLLWASELHGLLRRSPRVSASIPVLVRSEMAGHAWQEETKTKTLSRHGLQIGLRNAVRVNDVLTCTRSDNGWMARARVVWTRRKAASSGGLLVQAGTDLRGQQGELEESDVGLELLTEENFWEMESDGGAGVEARADLAPPGGSSD
jgi:hypothetical protein